MPLLRKLAVNANAHPADVVAVKTALCNLGFYIAPDWALFDAIQEFQKANGLNVDGVIEPGGKTQEVLETAGAAVAVDRDDENITLQLR
ncbi:MAG: peptidoglycan-binding protein [Magnetovibrio sp.]|nr:peptidoglycan-binding protein [Magnetovibrio sp.]